MKNSMKLRFSAQSVNEAFARSAVAAFCIQLNPTVEQLNDIKTVVSEAVTNCIVHAYEGEQEGEIEISAGIEDTVLSLEIVDFGKGIEDIEAARQPMFTTKPDEDRSGMGFTIMEAFSDSMEVLPNQPCGTRVVVTKDLRTGR